MLKKHETATTKAKTRQEIAAEFRISYSTFRRKLKVWNIKLPAGLLYGVGTENSS
ncbi:MAG: hypothetical protein AAGG68_07110 [Bacteroidota bacterium]